MDLRLRDTPPSRAEREAVDSSLGAPGGEEPRGRRHLLLPALHAVQARAGWLSEEALGYVAARLTVPLAEVYGVATFYAMFSLVPRPKAVAHVCDDVACRVRGAGDLCRELEQALGPEWTNGADGAVRAAAWLRSPCLGLCERAPAALVTIAGEKPREVALASATGARVVATLEGRVMDSTEAASIPQLGEPLSENGELRLLARAGRVDPGSLDDYRAHGGYLALRRAIDLGPDGVIREVIDSKLLGRGGAAFPAGRKWEAVARAAVRPHYIVLNADESEPGTFKDRVLMEEDPFALVEAMTIAGFATGSERGYIYVRGEYPLAAERLAGAIAAARARGLLGGDVMGRGFAFDIELRRGAGAYICGEETALFNSIEGFRGEPRNKPPFPTAAGLFGKPTLVNNVETLANVLAIVRGGGTAFAAAGTPDSTGTKLFCVSGCAARPGLYEVPFGTTLRALLELAGGVRGGRPLQAVLLGGAAGCFIAPGEIDVPLTFEGTRAIGASLGSGGVVVFDDAVDLWDILLRIAAFFRDESCGQCVPCRVGTVRQEEALRRLARGRPLSSAAEELRLIAEVGQAMRDASICGLGQTASSAIESALAKLSELEAPRRAGRASP